MPKVEFGLLLVGVGVGVKSEEKRGWYGDIIELN